MIGHFDDRRCLQKNDRVVAAWLADRFPDLTPVDPVAHFVARPVLDLSLTPGGKRDRQLRYGEPFEVLEVRDGAAFGSALHANYVGWVEAAALRPEEDRPAEALASVRARATHVYSEPSFKSPERLSLPHLSTVAQIGNEGRFTRTELGWIPTTHLGQDLGADPVSVAERYLGTPYLWGANSSFGIDCSGLVQASLWACGVASPGDSDLQEQGLGETMPPGTAPRRGDLLFWKGHVAWVADDRRILHANVHHMAVAFEEREGAVARIESQGDGTVTRHARLG